MKIMGRGANLVHVAIKYKLDDASVKEAIVPKKKKSKLENRKPNVC